MEFGRTGERTIHWQEKRETLGGRRQPDGCFHGTKELNSGPQNTNPASS